MRAALPRICPLCDREVFGALGMSVHRRRMHGPHHGKFSHPEPEIVVPRPPDKKILAYRARWKKEQKAARQIRPDIHERFQRILDRVQ